MLSHDIYRCYVYNYFTLTFNSCRFDERMQFMMGISGICASPRLLLEVIERIMLFYFFIMVRFYGRLCVGTIPLMRNPFTAQPQ